jgi:hypothetical protein
MDPHLLPGPHSSGKWKSFSINLGKNLGFLLISFPLLADYEMGVEQEKRR